MEELKLRPMGWWGILRATTAIMRRRYGSFMVVAAVLLVPAAVALSILTEFPRLPEFDLAEKDLLAWLGSDEVARWGREVAANLGFALGYTLVLAVAASAVFRLAATEFVGLRQSPLSALAAAFVRLIPIVVIFLMALTGITLGFILLVIPGVFVMVSWALWPGALMVENKKGVGALRRSWRLVRKCWWPVFGILVFIVLSDMVLNLIDDLIWIAIVEIIQIPPDVREVIDYVWTVSVNSFAEIFLFVVWAVIYLDLRVRKEGLDRQQLLLELS